MKFLHLLVLYLSATAVPLVLAIPLRHGEHCFPGSADVRCVGREDNRGRVPNPHPDGGSASLIHERGLSQTLKSILEGLPIIGPILAPLLGTLLGAIGLSELDVASASTASLNPEQIATLANFEFALSNAAHKVLSDGNAEGGAQSKLKARDAMSLGALITAVPLFGPFLQPCVPLLKELNLDMVDAKHGSVFNLALLNEDQAAKLAQFQTILRQEIASAFPNINNITTPDASVPPEASPNDAGPLPTPEQPQDTPKDQGSDPSYASPSNGGSPIDEPDTTSMSSLTPN